LILFGGFKVAVETQIWRSIPYTVVL